MKVSFSRYVRYWHVITLAVLLRVAYMVVTDAWSRGVDAGGHVDYVRFVLEHWAIPDRTAGWEFYQPPVYYFLTASVVAIGRFFFGVHEYLDMRLMQLPALLLSIATFIVCVGMVPALFGKKRPLESHLFLALLASIPAFVFFASRVNNDALYQFAAFAGVASLLRWWQKPSYARWIVLACILSFGLLTKTNVVMLFPCAAIALLLHPRLLTRAKWQSMLALVVLPIVIAGWFAFPALSQEGVHVSAMVGNARQMTGPSPIDIEHLFVFHPFKIVEYPFNDPYSYEARREYHWEFFFRSMLFSEFKYPETWNPLGVFAVIAALALIPFAGVSFVQDIRLGLSSSTLPLWVITLCLLVGALVYRILMPFSACSDFRFSLPLLIPFCYYAVVSVNVKRSFLNDVRWTLCVLLTGASVLFIGMFVVDALV